MSKRTSGVDLKDLAIWSSIAYASGFLTVMIHTARLGFPVLELFSARYVLIGAPFGLVGFLSTPILRYFRSRATDLAAQAKASWADLAGKVEPEDIDAISVFFGLLEALVPKFRFIRTRLEKRIRKHIGEGQQINDRTRCFLHRAAGIGKGFSAISGSLNLLSNAFLLVLGLVLYVWAIYPAIPQRFGGGKPVEVRLTVEQEKVPLILSDLRGVPVDPATRTTSKYAEIGPLKLLYASKDEYFLQGSRGERFSLSRGLVQKVVWSTKETRGN